MKTSTPTPDSTRLPSPVTSTPPSLAARPRRIRLVETTAVRGHGKLKVRPIEVGDEKEMIRFHSKISEERVYLRYFEHLGLDRRTTHERLVRNCTNTSESYAIVAERQPSQRSEAAILAVGRLTSTLNPYVATFDTLLIDDEKIEQLGKLLLRRLIKLARAFGFRVLTGDLLSFDHATINLCRKLGFTLPALPVDGLVRVSLVL